MLKTNTIYLDGIKAFAVKLGRLNLGLCRNFKHFNSELLIVKIFFFLIYKVPQFALKLINFVTSACSARLSFCNFLVECQSVPLCRGIFLSIIARLSVTDVGFLINISYHKMPKIRTPKIIRKFEQWFCNGVWVLKRNGKQCRPRSDCSKEQSDLGLHCLSRLVCLKNLSFTVHYRTDFSQ